jgi:hypothetical protein
VASVTKLSKKRQISRASARHSSRSAGVRARAPSGRTGRALIQAISGAPSHRMVKGSVASRFAGRRTATSRVKITVVTTPPRISDR